MLFSHLHVHMFQAVSFLHGFPINNLHAFLLYPTRVLCPANLTLLYVNALMELREEYSSLNALPCSCVKSFVTKSLIVPNVSLSAFLLNTVSLSVCPSFSVRETKVLTSSRANLKPCMFLRLNS